jgi:hypothetical protein
MNAFRNHRRATSERRRRKLGSGDGDIGNYGRVNRFGRFRHVFNVSLLGVDFTDDKKKAIAIRKAFWAGTFVPAFVYGKNLHAKNV